MQVGVIGLGTIGKIVAGHLVAAGLRTVVWNRSPQPAEELAAQGAIRAGTPAEALQSDIVLSLLLDDAAAREVFLTSGVLASAPAGTIHVCMSTISTALVTELVTAHRRHDLHYVAGPFFGVAQAAAAKQLNIVTAGGQEILDRVEPVLSLLGKTWRLGDDPPFAHLAKIAGNMMLGCAVEAMAEGAALFSSRGGDPAPFLGIMTQTLFNAPIYRNYSGALTAPAVIRPGVGAASMLPKDIRLALGEARSTKIRLPFAEIIEQRLQTINERGLADLGTAAAVARIAREPCEV